MTIQEEIIQNFIQFFQCMNKIPMHKQNSDITGGEKALMGYLFHAKEKVTSGSLAQMMQVGTGRVANALKNLEKKGLVIRERDDKDSRKVFVSLTEKGKEEVIKGFKVFKSNVLSLADRIGYEEMLRFSKECLKIKEVLVEMSQEKEASTCSD